MDTREGLYEKAISQVNLVENLLHLGNSFTLEHYIRVVNFKALAESLRSAADDLEKIHDVTVPGKENRP